MQMRKRHVFRSWQHEKRLMEDQEKFWREAHKRSGSHYAANEAAYYHMKVVQCEKMLKGGGDDELNGMSSTRLCVTRCQPG